MIEYWQLAQQDCLDYTECLFRESMFTAGFRYDWTINGWVK